MESLTDSNDLELRSEEVQEILGTPPHWLVRYGMLLALCLIILMAWASYWIVYPETVEVKIRVTTEDPPRYLYADGTREVYKILVASEDTVVAGQSLVVFESSATFEDVLSLYDYIIAARGKSDSVLLSWKPPNDLMLGELAEPLFAFLEQQEEVNESLSGSIANLTRDQKRTRIRQEQTSISFQRSRKANLDEQLRLAQESETRMQNLLAQGLGNRYELRQIQEEINNLRRQIQDAENTIKIAQIEIRQLRKDLESNETYASLNKAESMEDLKDRFNALQRAVERWEKEYMLVAPINGVVLFPTQIREKQFVTADDVLAVVAPASLDNLVGRTNLELSESGQVKEGQKVVIDFYSFPAQQYGAVEGVVSYKAKVPTDDGFIPIQVRFPNGLVTNTGRPLEVAQDMGGDMTIIIQQKRLIEWMLRKF